jgi:hypothetical protein
VVDPPPRSPTTIAKVGSSGLIVKVASALRMVSLMSI